MKDLIVVAYKNPLRAKEALAELRNLDGDWLVKLDDGVAVIRNYDGKLHVQDSYQMTSHEGAGWGMFLGVLLGGVVAAPFTAGASTVAAAGALAAGAAGGATLGGIIGAADAASTKEDVGLPEDFVNAVAATLQPGDSALFAVVESHAPDQLAQYFRGTGGRIIRTTLTPAQQAHIEAILSENTELIY